MASKLKGLERHTAQFEARAYRCATAYKRVEPHAEILAALSDVNVWCGGLSARHHWRAVYALVPRAAYNALLASAASELSCVNARAARAWTHLYNGAMKGA